MLLTADIGNTGISAGLFAGGKLLKRSRFPTDSPRFLPYLSSLLNRRRVEEAVICSVVPSVTGRFEKELKKEVKTIKVVGRDLRVPIKNGYRRPREVGQDRLVNAFGGVKLYGAPLIVIDFGTAVTIDMVSGAHEYIGGMIVPGLRLSLQSLREHTALLPLVKLRKPREFIGKDTAGSMLSGVIYGYAALVDDLVARIRREIGRRAVVVGTGGDAGIIAPYGKQLRKIDRDLTLKGLNLLAVP